MSTSDNTTVSKSIEFYGGYQIYSETGVDLTLLRENLRRSIEQRWEDNKRAVLFARVLQRGMAVSIPSAWQPEEGKQMFDAPAILQQLTAHQVEFVVIGGLAMIAHGSAAVTKDLDLCYNRTPDNLGRLVTAFAPLHPYLRGVPAGLPFKLDVPTVQAGLNFTLISDHGDVDLLGEVSGLGGYAQVLAQSQECAMYGLNVRILSLDGLILAKKAAGRAKDKTHLLELEEMKKLRDAAP